MCRLMYMPLYNFYHICMHAVTGLYIFTGTNSSLTNAFHRHLIYIYESDLHECISLLHILYRGVWCAQQMGESLDHSESQASFLAEKLCKIIIKLLYHYQLYCINGTSATDHMWYIYMPCSWDTPYVYYQGWVSWLMRLNAHVHCIYNYSEYHLQRYTIACWPNRRRMWNRWFSFKKMDEGISLSGMTWEIIHCHLQHVMKFHFNKWQSWMKCMATVGHELL